MTTETVTFEVKLSGYPSITAFVSFDVMIGYSCGMSTLTIPETIPFIDKTYVTAEPAITQAWELDTDLVEINSFLDCGSYQIEFSQSKDDRAVEALDSAIFTVDPDANTISLKTLDVTKTGVYLIGYEVSLVEYSSATPGRIE